MRTDFVTCRACNGTGRSPYRDNACCDQCDGWGKRIAPVTLSGHEITNTDLLIADAFTPPDPFSRKA